MYIFYHLIFICDMKKLFQKIFDRLFGNKWVCAYCGVIEYSTIQPYCKGCSHIERRDIKMFRIKR